MPDLSILTTAGPYHIIAYGTLLGTEFFQTFIGGIVAFKALPRPQFASLQQKIFPIYFSLQTALPVLLALTYPAPLLSPNLSSLSGVLDASNRSSTLYPLLAMFATSLLNLVVTGPATTRIMRERKHQETKDGKKSYDPAPHSQEMQRLNSAFAYMHGYSSLLNIVGFAATVWYGVTLAARLA